MRDLFKVLRISPHASEADVRSGYRRLALETHPDKGGSADAFRLVVEAFEILSDPCRRMAYETAFSKLGPVDASSGTQAVGHRMKKTAVREQHSPMKSRKRERAVRKSEQPIRVDTNDSTRPDIKELLRELLGGRQKYWNSRLMQLSEQTLRDLVLRVQSADESMDDEESEGIDGSDTDDDEDIHGKRATLALLNGSYFLEEHAESTSTHPLIDDAKAESTDFLSFSSVGGETAQRRKHDAQMRGICKSHGTFSAVIGLEYMLILSQSGLSLDIAIDMHISLVQLREGLRTDLQAGLSFRSALHQGIRKMQKDRELFQSTPMTLSFRVQCPFRKVDGKWTRERMQTRDVDEALSFWEKNAAEHVRQKNEAKLKRMAEKELTQQLRAKRRKKQECFVQKRNSLLVAVIKFLDRAEATRSKACKKRWGVHELPNGIEEDTLSEVGDCLRASLVLSDGSIRPGPLRQTLAEACADLNELSALQLKAGDAVACKELERRDIDAMTIFFRREMLE